MDTTSAVFDFSKVDVIVFSGDDVDFVEVGLVILFDDGVAMRFEIMSDSLLGLLTFFSGVFLWGFWCLEIRKGFAGFERFAMFGCESIFVYSSNVGFGAVADVFIEIIFGIFFC